MTFREEEYPDYKAQRPSMPADLKEQLPSIDRLVEQHDFPILRISDVAAIIRVFQSTKRVLDSIRIEHGDGRPAVLAIAYFHLANAANNRHDFEEAWALGERVFRYAAQAEFGRLMVSGLLLTQTPATRSLRQMRIGTSGPWTTTITSYTRNC